MVKVIIQKKNGEILEFDDIVNIKIPDTEDMIEIKENQNSKAYTISSDIPLNIYYENIFDKLKINDEIMKIEYEPGKRGNNLKFYTADKEVISMTAYWDYGVQRYIPDEALRNFIVSNCMYNLIDEGLFPIPSYNMFIRRAEGFFVYVPETENIEHFNILIGYSSDMNPTIDICYNFSLRFEEFNRYKDYIDMKIPYDIELNGRNLLLLRAGLLYNGSNIFNFVINLDKNNPFGYTKIRITDDRIEFIKAEEFFDIQ